MKRKKDHIRARSARAPETIDAVVATKTIWKNQSDIAEYDVATTADAVSSPSRSATSSADGP